MKTTIRLAAGLVAAASLTTACGRTHLAAPPAHLPALASGGGAVAQPASIPALASGGAAATPIAKFPGKVEYQVQGTLPALAASAPAYTVTATATDAQVGKLAAALGLHGAVTSSASGWTVSAASSVLHVEHTGGLPWSFDAPGPAVSLPACAEPPFPAKPGAAKAPAGAPVLLPCALPSPVAGLPTKAQAEQEVRTDLAAAGLDLDGASVDASGGFDEWFVTVTPDVDGVPVGAAVWSAAVGPHGTLVGASGWLASPVSAGDYPLVGVQAGLDRLRQGGWVLSDSPGGVIAVPFAGAGASANASTAVASPPQAAGGSAGSAGSASSSPASISPEPPIMHPGLPVPPVSPAHPVAPVAPMPPITLTVTGVHLGLAWAVPANATGGAQAWLVPVYVFELAGGGSVPVLAVSGKFVSPPSVITAP